MFVFLLCLTVRYTLSTDDEHVMNDIQRMIKENTDKFTTKDMGKDFYEIGSLVIWGKINTSVTKNRESVKKCMEAFVVNMLENCQLNSEKETKFTVKLDILKEIEGKVRVVLFIMCKKKNICSRCVEDPLMALGCFLLFGLVIVSLPHSCFNFLFYYCF